MTYSVKVDVIDKSRFNEISNLRVINGGLVYPADRLILQWPPRVPAVYLTSAFLAILASLSERRINNLRVCKQLDGSVPTAPTKPQETKAKCSADALVDSAFGPEMGR